MTLLVGVYQYNPATGQIDFLDSEPGRDMAGVEVCRHTFWGADIMISLGLKLLLQLKEDNLFVTGEDLNVLEHEIQIILQNIDQVLLNIEYDEPFVRHRTGNVLHAIERAKAIDVGVVIW